MAGRLTTPRALHMAMLAFAAVLSAVAAEEEEEIKVSSLNMGVALMLLGSIGFIMLLCYLMFHPDKDIRLYSWKVICATISIFVAVLLFQAFDGIVKFLGFGGTTLTTQLISRFTQLGVWFTILQVFLAYVCRVCGKQGLPDDKEQREEVLEKMELDIKCWATLLGHITGFSSIHAWCTLQQAVSNSQLGALLAIPVAGISLWGVHIAADCVREKVAAMDGRKDDNEKLWDEEVEETMEDVIGLTLSFMLVQSLRFGIGGLLPNIEGDLPFGRDLTFAGSVTLAGIGFASAATVFFRVLSGRHKDTFVQEMINLVCQFVFAWSIMFTVDATLERHGMAEEGDELGVVCAALIITAVSFGFIFVLDKIADINTTNPLLDKSIIGCVSTLGILIGFSWEKCFDIAVDDIAVEVHQGKGFNVAIPAAITKMVMAIALALFVTPAWRFYILPIVFQMGGFDKVEDEDAEAGTQKKTMRRQATNAGNVIERVEERRLAAKKAKRVAALGDTGYAAPLLGGAQHEQQRALAVVSEAHEGADDPEVQAAMGKVKALTDDRAQFQEMLAVAMQQREEALHERDDAFKKWDEVMQQLDEALYQKGDAEERLAAAQQQQEEAAHKIGEAQQQRDEVMAQLEDACRQRDEVLMQMDNIGQERGATAQQQAQMAQQLAAATKQRDEALKQLEALQHQQPHEQTRTLSPPHSPGSPKNAKELLVVQEQLKAALQQNEEVAHNLGEACQQRDAAAVEVAQALKQRDDVLQQMDGVVRQRAVDVQEREEAVKQLAAAKYERDEALKQLQAAQSTARSMPAPAPGIDSETAKALQEQIAQAIQERDDATHKLGEACQQRDAAIADLQHALLERDAVLQKMETLTQQRDEAVSSLQAAQQGAALSARSAAPAEEKLGQALKQTEEVTQKLGEACQQRDEAVVQLTEALRQRDEVMQQMGGVSEQRALAIQQREEAVKQLDAATQQRDEAMVQLTEALQQREAMALGRKQSEAALDIDRDRLEAQDLRIRSLEAELQAAQSERDELASRVEVLTKQVQEASEAAEAAAAAAEAAVSQVSSVPVSPSKPEKQNSGLKSQESSPTSATPVSPTSPKGPVSSTGATSGGGSSRLRPPRGGTTPLSSTVPSPKGAATKPRSPAGAAPVAVTTYSRPRTGAVGSPVPAARVQAVGGPPPAARVQQVPNPIGSAGIPGIRQMPLAPVRSMMQPLTTTTVTAAPQQSQAAGLFEAIDTNGDGQLTREELARAQAQGLLPPGMQAAPVPAAAAAKRVIQSAPSGSGTYSVRK